MWRFWVRKSFFGIKYKSASSTSDHHQRKEEYTHMFLTLNLSVKQQQPCILCTLVQTFREIFSTRHASKICCLAFLITWATLLFFISSVLIRLPLPPTITTMYRISFHSVVNLLPTIKQCVCVLSLLKLFPRSLSSCVLVRVEKHTRIHIHTHTHKRTQLFVKWFP